MPFQESMIETIVYCPIHLWTFYVGHKHVWYYLRLGSMRWNVTSVSDSWSELGISSGLDSFTSDWVDVWAWAPWTSSRADFLLAFGIFVYFKTVLLLQSRCKLETFKFEVIFTWRSVCSSLLTVLGDTLGLWFTFTGHFQGNRTSVLTLQAVYKLIL